MQSREQKTSSNGQEDQEQARHRTPCRDDTKPPERETYRGVLLLMGGRSLRQTCRHQIQLRPKQKAPSDPAASRLVRLHLLPLGDHERRAIRAISATRISRALSGSRPAQGHGSLCPDKHIGAQLVTTADSKPFRDPLAPTTPLPGAGSRDRGIRGSSMCKAPMCFSAHVAC